jgi:hypothetical protein
MTPECLDVDQRIVSLSHALDTTRPKCIGTAKLHTQLESLDKRKRLTHLDEAGDRRTVPLSP